MISIFALGFVTTIASTLFIDSTRFVRDEGQRIVVGENAGRVFTVLDPVLRQAKEVLDSVTIDGTEYSTGTTTVVLSLPSLLSDGSLSASDTDTAVITHDTSQADYPVIRYLLDPAPTSTRASLNQVVVEKAKDLYFRYTTAAPITGLTMTIAVADTVAGRSFTKTIVLYGTFRNHP